jgi:hypothetical protein
MARKWHDYGMADWKIGTQVICIKDYGDMKQGDKGVVVDLRDTMWSTTWEISYKDGSKKFSTNDSRVMKEHFVII